MNDVIFWGVAGGMTLAVGAALLAAMRGPHGDAGPAARPDLQIYRDQLAEIDRDLGRGTLPRDEADRMRAEISRRILGADRTAPAPTRMGPTLPVMGLVVTCLAASFGLYHWLGATGYPDLPLATRIAEAELRRDTRPSQAAAEAQVTLPAPATPDTEYANLISRLRDAVKANPDDVTGLGLLATNEAALGNFVAARTAQETLIALQGDAATAQDHADLAEIMIAMAGGYVSPEAESVLETALRIDPRNDTARYYAGLMMGQNGRYDLGFRFWRPLIDGPPDAPWMPALRAQIEDMAARAGIAYTLPPPDGLTPEAMVARLSERLATQGGPPEDWARLITSLTVLGNTEQAAAILAEARLVFAADTDALAIIEGAAP
jgi:cytochrome c-type biogenesis protein CcmH